MADKDGFDRLGDEFDQAGSSLGINLSRDEGAAADTA